MTRQDKAHDFTCHGTQFIFNVGRYIFTDVEYIFTDVKHIFTVGEYKIHTAIDGLAHGAREINAPSWGTSHSRQAAHKKKGRHVATHVPARHENCAVCQNTVLDNVPTSLRLSSGMIVNE